MYVYLAPDPVKGVIPLHILCANPVGHLNGQSCPEEWFDRTGPVAKGKSFFIEFIDGRAECDDRLAGYLIEHLGVLPHPPAPITPPSWRFPLGRG